MGKISLDLAKFKHVSSDENTTTLKHSYLGHSITLAHNKLSREHKDQIMALADKAKGAQKGKTQQAPADQPMVAQAPPMMASGGEIPGKKVAYKKDYVNDVGVGGGMGRGAATVSAGSAASGAASSNAIPQAQKPYGATINVVKPTPGNGKVIMMADGGDVPKDINEVIDSSYSVDPIEAAPALKQAYQIGTENSIQERKGDLLERDMMKANVPFHVAADPMSPEAAELQAAKEVQARQDKGMMQRVDKSTQEQGVKDQLAMQKAQMGLAQPEGAQQPMPASQAPAAQMPTPENTAQQMQSGVGGIPDPTAGMTQGYETQIQGLQQEAAAKGALGQENAGILQKNQARMQEMQNHYQRQYEDLENERKAHIEDIQNGHIDPNKYWTGDKDGNGGHSKMATAIGIILAGFNPTSRPNAAIEFLQKQMEMNLQSQAKNLDSHQNLLSANMKQFGNLHDAMQMTRLMQNDVVTNELQVAANKAASPMAKAAALQAIGPLQRESAQLQQQLALRRMMMGLNVNGSGGDSQDAEKLMGYLRVTNPEMAKSMEQRFVPGVGLSSINVPDKVREEIVAHKNFNDAAKDLVNWSKQHTTFIPGTPEYNTGVQKAMVLQSLIREGLLGTVYREGEQPLLDKMLHGNPANLLKEFNTLPQLKELIRSNDARGNTLKKTYGLPQSAPEVDNDIVKGKDGKSYQKRVVNGKVWMVPVQGRK